MTLEQITGENLFEVESGLSRLSSQDPDAILKFVLLESPDGRGFIRIDKGPEHVNTLGRLNRYLSDQGESPSTFTKHGGGWVNIYRHNTTKLGYAFMEEVQFSE